ncbi:MAG: hypothetical protein V4671_23810 [Armatimonadota bacterium]
MNAKVTFAIAAAVLCLPTAQPALLPAAHAAAVIDELRSQLPGFTYFQMPDKGQRLTDAELVKTLTEPLKTFAKDSGIELRATEVVQWTGADNSSTRDMLMYTLKGAGYEYNALGDKKGDDSTMYIFTAKNSSGNTVAGYWIDRKGQLVLVWGSRGPDAPRQPATENKPAAKSLFPANDEESAAKPGAKIPAPASLTGTKWSMTTIGGVNYVRQNGTLTEPSGMSASYKFTKDGRYDYFFYIRQRTYSLGSEATSTHSGTVKFSDNNTFTLYPEKGWYKGNTGSRLIDRPMTAEERKPVQWYYEWRMENGKRVLYIGPSKSSVKLFKAG